MGNAHEVSLNSKLAHFLRTRGLEAQAEQQVVAANSGKRHRADILVELEDRSVAIEAEFHPGSKVQREREACLREPPLYW